MISLFHQHTWIQIILAEQQYICIISWHTAQHHWVDAQVRNGQEQTGSTGGGKEWSFSKVHGDMQHVPCQRGVTLLQLYIQLKRTACPAEFRKERKAVFCSKIIWLKTANTTQILRVNELTLAFCMCQKLHLLRETAKFQTCEFVEEQNVQLDFRASAWRNYSLVAI